MTPFWRRLTGRVRRDTAERDAEREGLRRELHLSRAQRDLATEQLREVQARLDRLQASADAQTERRRAQRRD